MKNIFYIFISELLQAPSEHKKYFEFLQDGGPFYTETDPSHVIVEPWNALSSLFIALPAVYWFFKLSGRYKIFPFLTYCIPLLLLNSLGSTFFHAFRASQVFLFLDIVPAALLSLSISVYFWLKILKKWWQILFVIVPFLYLRVLIYDFFSPHTAINLSYAITGILIFLPVLKYLYNTRFKHFLVVIGAIVTLSLALLFREMDAWETQIFPIGTHFLWHIFSGIGGFLIADYLYLLRKNEVQMSNLLIK